MTDEHVSPRVLSDEALDELGRALSKILGIPEHPVVGFTAALVVADPLEAMRFLERSEPESWGRPREGPVEPRRHPAPLAGATEGVPAR
jgi:hypothetical protein